MAVHSAHLAALIMSFAMIFIARSMLITSDRIVVVKAGPSAQSRDIGVLPENGVLRFCHENEPLSIRCDGPHVHGHVIFFVNHKLAGEDLKPSYHIAGDSHPHRPHQRVKGINARHQPLPMEHASLSSSAPTGARPNSGTPASSHAR